MSWSTSWPPNARHGRRQAQVHHNKSRKRRKAIAATTTWRICWKKLTTPPIHILTCSMSSICAILRITCADGAVKSLQFGVVKSCRLCVLCGACMHHATALHLTPHHLNDPLCCWMLLDAFGCCAVGCRWMLLDAVGCRWMLLDVGPRWMLLDVVGCCWMLLGVVGCCWVLLGAVGCCWVLLGVVG